MSRVWRRVPREPRKQRRTAGRYRLLALSQEPQQMSRELIGLRGPMARVWQYRRQASLLVRLLVCLEIHVVTARRRTFDAWRALSSELVVRKMAYWLPTWIGFPRPVVHYAVRSQKKSPVGENGIVMWCLSGWNRSKGTPEPHGIRACQDRSPRFVFPH
jgi:hypothetical protein